MTLDFQSKAIQKSLLDGQGYNYDERFQRHFVVSHEKVERSLWNSITYTKFEEPSSCEELNAWINNCKYLDINDAETKIIFNRFIMN